jgi:hypothetical protein
MMGKKTASKGAKRKHAAPRSKTGHPMKRDGGLAPGGPGDGPTPTAAADGSPGIFWKHGVDGLLLCAFGGMFLFRYSAFFGLAAIGVGSLLVGIAFGRD